MPRVKVQRIPAKKLLFTFAITCAILALFIPFPTYAEHGPGEQICQGADDFSSEGPSGFDRPGFDTGIFVPVKDFEAEAYLDAILSRTEAIESDVDRIDLETRAVRYYLRQLCEKEYVHDHTIQHAWAEVIGQFVDATQAWVRNAYNANPIFLTNQTVYYTLVEGNVLKTFIHELGLSNIDPLVRETVSRTAQQQFIQSVLGSVLAYDPNQAGPEIADQERIRQLASYGNFANQDEYQSTLYQALRLEHTEVGLTDQLINDLSLRMQRAVDYEREKLAWGRGFFSYENCDLNVITDFRADRRNCRIVTPGSLIQDQVSFVFGSALRQMELADEFEEWIAPNTVAVLNDILNWSGLNSDRSRDTVTTDPTGPQGAGSQIQTGTLPPADERFPVEFDVFIEAPPEPPRVE